MHPKSNKMYCELRELYWWPGLNLAITKFVEKCLNCQKVKVEHQYPLVLLQPHKIPEWKRERITMNFFIGFPVAVTKKDVIWVIVDRLTKSVHFLVVRTSYTL